MTKMFRLIQNEFIKTFKKPSTFVLFILLLIICTGFMLLMKFTSNEYGMYWDDYAYVDYDLEIKKAENQKYTGYELDIEKYTFMKENDITTGWKYDACEEFFGHVIDDNYTAQYVYSDAERESFKQIIINNEWEKYCEYRIAALKESGSAEEEYWQYQYRLDNNIPLPSSESENYNWQNKLISSVTEAKCELADNPNLSADEKADYENKITLALYRLDNNIDVNLADIEDGNINEFNIWIALSSSTMLVSLIGIFMIVLTGSTVANEFSQGTIKFLLINPVKRWKILVAKYLTAMLIGYFMILLCYAVNVLLSILLFGTADLGATYITASNGEIISTPGLVYLLQKYAVSSVNVVVMATLAFAISSLLRSSAVATGVSVFAVFGGNMIVSILYALKIDWARYLIFANTDLWGISHGDSDMSIIFENQTVGFAIGVIIVHMIVFLLTAWDGFTRREV